MKPITHVVAAILYNEKNEFLLSSRPEGKPYAGYWEFAGGKVERGESEFEALQRELYEELGITIHHARIWLSKIYYYEHATVYLRFFRIQAQDWSGTLTAKEGQKWAWQQAGHENVSPMLPANQALIKALAIPQQWTGTPQTGLNSSTTIPYTVLPHSQFSSHQTCHAVLFQSHEFTAYQAEQEQWQSSPYSIWLLIHTRQQFIDYSQEVEVIVWQVDTPQQAQDLHQQLQDGSHLPICAYTTPAIAQEFAHLWQTHGLHALILNSESKQ